MRYKDACEIAKEVLREITESDNAVCYINSAEDKEWLETAVKALEMAETHNMIEKGVLKQRGEGYVYYDINWLKKWWRHEMEILGINTWE